jgi:hypothetical protein
VQHRLINALANIDKPDRNVPDIAAGQRDIAELRRLASQASLLAADLASFADKVERRIEATRALFISMAGFRSTAVDRYRHAKENRLVLLDGNDLTWILEGRFDFTDALRAKVRAAPIQGDPYVSVHSL